jgi:amidohydrolase
VAIADLSGGPPDLSTDVRTEVVERAAALDGELVALRRDLHAHPELGRQERRTIEVLRARLAAEQLTPQVLADGAGLVCDIGPDTGAGLIGLRADLDALPVADEKDVPYRSTVPGVCHACGHDVHAAAVLGAGLVLAGMHAAGRLAGGVRLVFQPAEELTPGGALDLLAAGGLDGVQTIYCLHCDPAADVGSVGLRVGPVTGSADQLEVRLTGPGGHTARPHLTADLVYALGQVATQVPGVLSRLVDPRAGLSVVWGHVAAGAAPNAIPREGLLAGTVRTLDAEVWRDAPDVVGQAVRAVLAPYPVEVEVSYTRGVPPVVNDGDCVGLLDAAAAAVVGPDSVHPTAQSLGGEDFAWYLAHIPGALARLGVRHPGATVVHDLHQGSFDVDERAIGVGARLLAATALLAAS